MSHPRDIVAHVLNAKCVFKWIVPDHVTAGIDTDSSRCGLINNEEMHNIKETWL